MSWREKVYVAAIVSQLNKSLDIRRDLYCVDCLVIMLSILSTSSFDYRFFELAKQFGEKSYANDFGFRFFSEINILPNSMPQNSQREAILKPEYCDFFDGRLFVLICAVRNSVVSLGFSEDIEIYYDKIWSIIEKCSAFKRLNIGKKSSDCREKIALDYDEHEEESDEYKLDIVSELLSIIDDNYCASNSERATNTNTNCRSIIPTLKSDSLTTSSTSISLSSSSVLGGPEVDDGEILYEANWHWHNTKPLEDFLWTRGVKVRANDLLVSALIHFPEPLRTRFFSSCCRYYYNKRVDLRNKTH
jgi:hypothetical protein